MVEGVRRIQERLSWLKKKKKKKRSKWCPLTSKQVYSVFKNALVAHRFPSPIFTLVRISPFALFLIIRFVSHRGSSPPDTPRPLSPKQKSQKKTGGYPWVVVCFGRHMFAGVECSDFRKDLNPPIDALLGSSDFGFRALLCMEVAKEEPRTSCLHFCTGSYGILCELTP